MNPFLGRLVDSILVKMNFKKSVIYGFILLLNSNLYSDLIWTPETGWYAEGGVLEAYIGTDIEAKNALEYMEKARAAQEKKAYRRALSAYRKVYRDYPLSILAPEALYQSGRIQQTRKRWIKAFNLYDQVAKRHPDYGKFLEVIKAQFEIATAFKDGARLRAFGLIPGLRSPDRAIEYYNVLIANAPYSEYAPQALMNISIIAQKKNDSDIAIDALERLIENYPESPLAAEGHLTLAEIYADLVDGPEYDQGLVRKAMSYYDDFLVLYPKSEHAAQAEAGREKMEEILAQSKFILGEFYYIYRHDTEAAKAFYSEAITVAPKSISAEKARERFESIENGAKLPKAPGTWLLGPPKPVERRTL